MPPPTPPTTSPLNLEPLEPLLRYLADLVADRLAARLAAEPATDAVGAPTRRLLSLDQLLDQLPTGKSAQTWRSWLYQRTRLGQVPGCHKLGGRLFFDPEQTIPWILTGATNPPRVEGLDLAARSSLHAPSMADDAGHRQHQGDNA